MGEVTAIRWTDHTFNPWWGCVKVSPACDRCYAERDAHRYGFADGGGNGPELWGKGSERRRLSDKQWAKPLQWDRAAAAAGRKALVFCASMADVFEARDDLDPERARLWELIEATPNLIWLLLTKRPEQVLKRIPPRWIGVETSGANDMVQVDRVHRVPWQYVTLAERVQLAARPTARACWPMNVWVGTTVEDQHYADLRIPRLLDIPSPVRWLSVEPLLGPLDLSPWIDYLELKSFGDEKRKLTVTPIDWVIVGGESGPGHRPMDLDWARELRGQCNVAGIPFFFKQVGGTRPTDGGKLLDGELYEGFPTLAGDRSWASDATEVSIGAPGRS